MSELAPAGIDEMAFATAHRVLDLAEIARRNGVEVGKYYVGLGQRRMSVAAEDEDPVTMGAEAARAVLDRAGVAGVRTLVFATESGVDQSKSAGVYAHRLLGLPAHCRVVEIKQACYSATAALQFGLGLVAREPSEKVLVVASDIARYRLGSAGEPTQGAAAVAFLVGANPGLMAIEPVSGIFTAEIDDFWRPNGMSEALVDGKLSLEAYLGALEGAWGDYRSRGGAGFGQIDRFCYHQPFAKMALKAHARLHELAGSDAPAARLDAGLALSREVGNSYTASLYLGLLSLLENDPEDLSGRRVGLFAYGSGCVGEFLAGIVQPGYRTRLRPERTLESLVRRVPVGYEEYRILHELYERPAAQDYGTAAATDGPFRFAGVSGMARRYERRA